MRLWTTHQAAACCVVLVSFLYICNCQQASLSMSAGLPCKQAGHFLDISTLECKACDQVMHLIGSKVWSSFEKSPESHRILDWRHRSPLYIAANYVVVQAAGYVPSGDKLSCVLCDPSSGNTTSFGNGFSMVSAWDPASLTAGGACQCSTAAAGTVISTVSEAGRDLQRCLVCPAGSTADASTGTCVPASGPLSTPLKDLTYVLNDLNSQGAGILAATATQVGAQYVPSQQLKCLWFVAQAALDREQLCLLSITTHAWFSPDSM